MGPKAAAALNVRLEAGLWAAPLHRGQLKMRTTDGEDVGYTEWPKRARMAGRVIDCPNS